jgi:hypothetical protein
MGRAPAACEFAKFSSLQAGLPLKAIDFFSRMPVKGQEENCEQCGSPLDEGGLCWSCSGGAFQSGSSPMGAAPLERSELAKVLGRGIGDKAHGAYSLSMQQAEGMAHLRDQIESMVEQFNASPQTKNSVKQSAERNAIKLLPQLGPTKAAIASVAQEFLSLGRSMGEASFFISKVRPRVGRLSSLVIEVYAPDGGTVDVLINGRKREFKSQSEGLYRRLRIPVYCWDEGAVMELGNAVLCAGRYPAKRMRAVGSKFLLVLPEKTFELFKILEEAKLSGAIPAGELVIDPINVVRKYSVAKLPFTERLLRATGYLNAVNGRYSAILRQKIRYGNGRMPRKLAEEALIEACHREVPAPVVELVVKRYHLKPSEVSSLLLIPELDAWKRMDAVS